MTTIEIRESILASSKSGQYRFVVSVPTLLLPELLCDPHIAAMNYTSMPGKYRDTTRLTFNWRKAATHG
jgi:hypothetical protein